MDENRLTDYCFFPLLFVADWHKTAHELEGRFYLTGSS